MKVYARTDIGPVRALNEDSYYIPADGENFCCVADGMGGHNAGEVASAIAVETMASRLRDKRLAPHERLRRAVYAANAAIYDKAHESQSMSGMGTTVTALLIEDGEAHIAHVGDSRCYLLRNKTLMQLTSDHTYVEELLLQGVITMQEARNHPNRNVITRALGTEPNVQVDMLRISLQPGDMFLMCSDGLSGYVSDRDMLETLNSRVKRENKVSALVDQAIDGGGHDNITALLVNPEEEIK
ncbi:MAG: Stp1/IreP family PP2C-type Ser/Thr phosphatase [Clostridia bacterium]|nr:Stp1/IreP family PP2C-type Ser/Thr phosphatase [Clostridia bacterium]